MQSRCTELELLEDKGMSRRRVMTLGLTALLAVLATDAWSQSGKSQDRNKDKDEDKDATTRLRIEVTGGDAGDPVDNASVYIRWERERKLAKDKKYEQNWKTNREGVVKVPSVPRGKVIVQVIAQGWKTYGQWYDLDQDEMTIKIRLQKPPKWY
jgi:hypothetical protein